MYILVAGFQHETNSFAQGCADWAAFERGETFPAFARGPGFLAAGRHVGLPIRGFAEAARAAGDRLVESCWAGAAPSGPITAPAFATVRDAILDDAVAARRAGRLDAVYLDLHGAAVTESDDAPELTLLAALREAIGPDTPLVASLDLHANVDARLLALVDAATAYRTYPHVDMVDTGRRAHALLVRRCAAGARPLVAMQRIPFLIPAIAQSTLVEPARGVQRLLAELETTLACDASFTAGFPASDVPHCGPTVWAYGPNAAQAVRQIAEAIVAARPGWRVRLPAADDAVREALRLADGGGDAPVVIADPQDNPGAGTCGATTGLLRALLAAGAGTHWPGRVAIGLMNDPPAARAAHAAGVGAVVELAVGTSVPCFDGSVSEPPVTGRFTVRALRSDPVVLTGPMMHGASIALGPSACLELDGILVCVCSASMQVLDRSMFRALGVEPAAMAIVALKGAVHFRADFEPLAARILVAKSRGEMAADPADLPWRRLRATVAAAC